MDYETAIKTTVSRAQAESEIDRHGCNFEEFIEECGDQPHYSGEVVLHWLGY